MGRGWAIRKEVESLNSVRPRSSRGGSGYDIDWLFRGFEGLGDVIFTMRKPMGYSSHV